jgi:hypothetical protein
LEQVERAAVLALERAVVVDAVATGSTTNTVNLIHFIVVLFLWFRVVASTVGGLLVQVNCMHSGSGEKAIDFSGLGGVPVLTFRTMCM